MNKGQYYSASHSKYLIQYHIIWYPKFRYSVLGTDVSATLNEYYIVYVISMGMLSRH